MTRSLLALASILALVTFGAARADSKTGEAKFTGPKKESIQVELGDKLKLNAEFHQMQVGRLAAVSVKAKIKNTTSRQMYFSYNVAFLDKDKNLIGCQSFPLPIGPNQDSTAGTFITLPRDQIAKIAYYSVAFHESDQQIGQK